MNRPKHQVQHERDGEALLTTACVSRIDFTSSPAFRIPVEQLAKLQCDEMEEGVSTKRRRLSFSPKEKMKAALRVLAGEQEATVAEDLGVSLERLQRWQAVFVEGGHAALAKREEERHGSWFARHRKAIIQWTVLLIVLVGTILLFTRVMSGPASP